MPVVSPRRQWQWWWWWCCSSLFVVPVLLTQWPSSLDRVVPLLLAYALMPPDHVAAGGRGGSRVRETKKALLGRSRLTSAQLRSPFVASTAGSSACAVVPIVVKGTVSKITEKFQTQPPPAPPPRTLTRIPKPLRVPDRGVVVKPLPPPLPPLPPPVVKYEIKRRQEKLLGELHRRRGLQGNRPTTASLSSGRLPVGGGGDSAVSSDCGSSSDSEKSVCCGGRSIDKPDDKPGSPHSSGYESVEETMTISTSAAVPYSWVFGAPEPHDGFDGPSQLLSVTSPLAPPPLSTSSSASSDGCCEGDDDDDDDDDDEDDILTAPEDRLERLVTFASAKSCPALTRAKPDQDDDEDVPVVVIRRHFGGGNDGPKPVAAMAGYLSPIPECSSTEPNSVETVEDCCGYDDDKIFFRANVLQTLETQRDEKLSGIFTQLQARCRGYLARKDYAKRKVNDIAVRCIQRNVKKFMVVRDWPWWRLLVRITPLLNVHRTEYELKQKSDELEQLRNKVDKLEQERSQLKMDNDRLEQRLAETTGDLAEEHSTVTMVSERLQFESAERQRLEKELLETQTVKTRLAETNEQLEMQLLCMRSTDPSLMSSSSSVAGTMSDDDSAVVNSDKGDQYYRRRYERVCRELEYAKKRLQQQHNDDMEQLLAMKKQLEKKLAGVYEDVEEQRQIVAQWKRKVNKLNSESNDLKLMLEESNSRNNLLEKKQKKFDTELHSLQEELKKEKAQREKITREKDMAMSDKFSMEQTLSSVKLELELKEQKVVGLNRELQELTFSGNTEEEVAALKRSKHQLESKLKDQEEELDDLAGQVQLLEQVKTRLEMGLEQERKEHRRELAQREQENEETRCSAAKKIKALECEIENEHEERTALIRERHDLERRLVDSEDRERCRSMNDQESIARLRRDMKKLKALLRDAQTVQEQRSDSQANRIAMRQLRNQLEDAESARDSALKARSLAETDLAEVTASLDEAQVAKRTAEERAAGLARDKNHLQGQLDENEEELAEVLKKYRGTVQQLSAEQTVQQEQASRIAELDTDRANLQERLAELTFRLDNMETHGDPAGSLNLKRLQLRVTELESKLQLELTTRTRLEVQIARLKETVDRLESERETAQCKENAAQEAVRKMQRSLREARESMAERESRESADVNRKRALEKRAEQAESEVSTVKSDLALALQRIDDLQAAMTGDLDDDDDEFRSSSDDDDDDGGDGDSDDSVTTFLANQGARNTTILQQQKNVDSNN
ncbi:unconventional myosin-XVIIIa-like isoform X3 [Metopolophium dirhodum]|uniref:unconventional myosin-XVIIIa-like isoform X3 n=1 Tax=Metopolophium dirhodum TaxID=44670 RepID=UPI00298F88F5|nr:unconventional myosin-XVIIIa-like isoform X3 [Metopolophium dirhodum]